MKTFDDYFSFDNIVDFLAKQRVKIAFQAHQECYLDKILATITPVSLDSKSMQILQTVLPARKKWSRPNNYAKRYKLNTSIEINKTALKNTIYKTHRQFESKKIEFLNTPVWYQNLRKYIFEIKLRVFQDSSLQFEEPCIIPQPKEKNSKEMRPIADFNLSDKLILGITNKYLTSIFDNKFLECSTAFRQSIGDKRAPKHHDVISEIRNFRILHNNTNLYVAECDIKKFFDCVYHQVIRKRYLEIKKEFVESNIIIAPTAELIFEKYLDAYSFNRNVMSKNVDTNYWLEHDKVGSKFGWVDTLVVKYSEGSLGNERIGIPQGGALSGLMVNIIMHNIDQRIMDLGRHDSKFLYKRYCDDMVIIHDDHIKCQQIFEEYKKALTDNSLEYHPPHELKRRYSKTFWGDKIKSRNTYYWGERPLENLQPQSKWISFLGYMINYKGDLKIRKKSFDKQKTKHEKELKKVIYKLKDVLPEKIEKQRYSILYSFESKLFSMAVGKVNLSNYKNESTKMCWGDGFKLIENNKFVQQQLKELDYSRGNTVGQLRNYIKKRTKDLIVEEHDKKEPKDGVIEIGYPHSFFSLLERKLK